MNSLHSATDGGIRTQKDNDNSRDGPCLAQKERFINNRFMLHLDAQSHIDLVILLSIQDN